MFLARAATRGCFGDIGLVMGDSAAPNTRCSFNSDASAIEPRPRAHRLKKWRRVMLSRSSLGLTTFASLAGCASSHSDDLISTGVIWSLMLGVFLELGTWSLELLISFSCNRFTQIQQHLAIG